MPFVNDFKRLKLKIGNYVNIHHIHRINKYTHKCTQYSYLFILNNLEKAPSNTYRKIKVSKGA